ncbi:MAG: hypothetical protein HYU69_06375 [Bacteroidetes bacterium]|nr:hypothetical protein [Bacteroidota bacterium]
MKSRKRDKSPELFNLVKSLTGPEKRYFTVFAQRHVIGEENKYLKLFDAIDEQMEYNEEALLKRFSKEKFSRQLHVAKNYLYEMILKSMRVFHSKKTFQSEVRELLDYADFLCLKKQSKQFNKIITKAKKLALDNDLYAGYIEASEMQLRYMEGIANVNWLEENLEGVYFKQSGAIAEMANFQQYRKLAYETYILSEKVGFARSENDIKKFDKLLGNNVLLEKRETALSDRSRIIYYHLNGIYFLIKEKIKESLKSFTDLTSFIKSDPGRLRQYIRNYLFTTNNIISILIKHATFEKTLRYINSIREVPEEIIPDNEEHFIMHYNNILRVFTGFGRFNESTNWLLFIEQWIVELKGKNFQKNYIFRLYYNLAYMNFGIGKYKQALIWLNAIEGESNNNLSIDINCRSRILKILIQYELDGNEFSGSEVRSVSRYLKKVKRFHKTEQVLFVFLDKKISKISSQKERVELFRSFKKEVEHIFQDPEEKRAMEYFDFISWLGSKIERRSFAEIVRGKALKKSRLSVKVQ